MQSLTHTIPHHRNVNDFNMACQVDQIKTYKQFKENIDELRSSLQCNPIAARDHCFWTASKGTEFCSPSNHIPPFPQTYTHHCPCKTKLISLTTKIMTIKKFTGRSVLKERKISVPKELIAKSATTYIVLERKLFHQRLQTNLMAI